MNRSLSNVDTMFLMSDSSYSFVSSSLIKEVFLQGGEIGKYVPDVVLEYMQEKRRLQAAENAPSFPAGRT
jgi:pantetheine-phosphate adenylyltransferase